ncbi:eukaryotic membrane protein family-domain-containing protein [Haematococcus lacustris]
MASIDCSAEMPRSQSATADGPADSSEEEGVSIALPAALAMALANPSATAGSLARPAQTSDPTVPRSTTVPDLLSVPQTQRAKAANSRASHTAGLASSWHTAADLQHADAPEACSSQLLPQPTRSGELPQQLAAIQTATRTGNPTPRPSPSQPVVPDTLGRPSRLLEKSGSHGPSSLLGAGVRCQILQGSEGAEPNPSLEPGLSRVGEEGLQTWRAYLAGEARPAEKVPTADVVWGQTERERVYNYLLYVPYQLERLIQFSTLLCLDAFLALITLMPLRALRALARLCGGARPGPAPQPSPSTCSTPRAGGQVEGPRLEGDNGKASGSRAGQAGVKLAVGRLGGGEVYDILCLIILVAGTSVLRAIKPGFIYFYFKDITSEFLKMSVLSSVFEIADKILANFGLDVLEALSGTCTQWVAGRKRWHHLAADSLVAFAITTLHAVTLMCQGLVLAVALNSKRNGLMALLIANNFVEIKGAVFKRWDIPRIWGLVCLDTVERLHLLSVVLFVLVEDMDSAACWAASRVILRESARILGWEVVIDIVKHSVLGKFNDVRPGIYREYMKDLCDKAVSSQSHSLHKLLNFQHLAPGCLLMRNLTTLFWLRLDATDPVQVALRSGCMLSGWLLLLVTRPLLGYSLKCIAYNYVLYHERMFGVRGGSRGVARPMAGSRDLRGPTGMAHSKEE